MTARGAAARAKGIRFERFVAADLGVKTTRNTRPGLHDDAGDVVLPGWLVELKAQERWSVETWWDKAAGKATDGDRVALVLHRDDRPNTAALVVVAYDTWKGMLP